VTHWLIGKHSPAKWRVQVQGSSRQWLSLDLGQGLDKRLQSALVILWSLARLEYRYTS